MLTKKAEISVTEEKKGKQIAVKENNITSLKQFFQSNYSVPVSPAMPTVTPVSPTPQISQEVINTQPQQPINNMVINPTIQPSVNPVENAINNGISQNPITNETIVQPTPTVPPIVDTPVITNPVESIQNATAPVPNIPITPTPVVNSTPVIQSLETDNNESTGATEAIKLVPEPIISEQLEEEMDPELKEIKERLDQVINDLNNYKKKIKILEKEVNQNLEKSREVLKDTQAAAKIMAIQQERQKQITEEINGTAPINDPSRVLQKETI